MAGGSGTRMGTELPKQFLPLVDTPIIFHTLQKFAAFDPNMEFVVVLPADHIALFKNLKKKHGFNPLVKTVTGGETRFHSVKNGVFSIEEEEAVVGIHDAVRPLVNGDTLARTYGEAEKLGNAIPVVPLVESVRQVFENSNKAVNREAFRVVQTPQCFYLSHLKKAFQQSYSAAFTDDATVLEAMGHTINLVEGNRENIKITTQNDLQVAEAYLSE